MGPTPVVIGTSLEKWRQPDGTIKGVKRGTRFVVRFSRPMAPSSSSRANFAVGSGSFPSVELITPRVDPVERAVIFGPKVALERNTQYDLQIRSGEGANVLAAFDGAQFQGSEVIHFTTADDDDVSLDFADLPAPNPCEVYELFTNCAGTYCHGNGKFSPSGDTVPAMGLNLLFPAKSNDPSVPFLDPIQATAVGHPALEVQDPSNVGGTPTVQPRNFPIGMAIIEPGSSAASYLMYKILMHPPNLGSSPAAAYIDPTVPDLPNAGQATADDLATRMFGQPMPNPQRVTDPPPDDQLAQNLLWIEREKIRNWIDDGAPACPCANYNPQTYVCPPPKADAGVDSGDASGDATDETSDAGLDSGAAD